jgi:hypothetical protein
MQRKKVVSDTTKTPTEEIKSTSESGNHNVKSKAIKTELLFIVSSTVLFSLYVRTSYPSIAGGDSGELAIAAYQLGATHSPG